MRIETDSSSLLPNGSVIRIRHLDDGRWEIHTTIVDDCGHHFSHGASGIERRSGYDFYIERYLDMTKDSNNLAIYFGEGFLNYCADWVVWDILDRVPARPKFTLIAAQESDKEWLDHKVELWMNRGES